MDSFEARLQFIAVLKNLQKTLNSSSSNTNDNTNSKSPNFGSANANDPIQFYLKNYRQHYEDFHQCLFDTTAKMDPLDRLNVLLYYSKIIIVLRAQHSEFNHKVLNQHLLPSLDKMLLLTLPSKDWKSLTNLRFCIEIFQSLNSAYDNMVQWRDTIDTIEHTVPIETLSWYTPDSTAITPQESFTNSLKLLKDRQAKQQFLFQYYKENGVCNLPTSSTTSTIIHRMENEREKHKRRKENNWVLERIDNNFLDPQEFLNIWNHESSKGLTKEDYKNINEINNIAQQSYAI